MIRHIRLVTCIMIAALATWSPSAPAFPTPLGNAITFQGQLQQGGSPANGAFDFQVKLFDALTVGTQIGTTQTPSNVAVTNGVFSIDLDFGAGAFDGNERFVELAVRTAGGGAFTTLTPRIKLNPAPYAQFAKTANIAGSFGNQVNFTNASNSFAGSGANLTGINASNIAGGSLASSLLSGTYSNALTLNNASNSFAGSGAGLTALNATNITSGTLNTARLPTGGAWTLTSLLNLDSNTLVVDPINNRVGIGTAAPSERLHILDSLFSNILLERTGGASVKIEAQGSVGDIGTSNAFPFRFNTNNAVRMTIDPAGNVGIGTTAPAAPLHVQEGFSGAAPNGNSIAVLERNAGGFLSILGADGNSKGILFGNVSDPNSGGIVYDQASVATESMQFRTGGNATRMTISNDGNVGIGTTGPTNPLTVLGAGDTHGGAGASDVVARFNNTTSGQDAAIAIDSQSNRDSSIYLALNGSAQWELNNNHLAYSQFPELKQFNVRYRAGGANLECFHINVNSTAVSAGCAMELNGHLLPAADNTYLMGGPSNRWSSLYSANGFVQTSDARVKRDVHNITNGLDEIMNLRPVSYVRTDGKDPQRELGLIAQEVEAIVPEAVVRPSDPSVMYGMKYTTLVPVLISAVQTQQHTIDQLRQDKADLESRLAALEQAVASLQHRP